MEFAIELIRCRGDKFVNQIVKVARLDNEVRTPKFLSKRVDHRRKIFRLGQPGFSKQPHLLQHNLY
jgi:hypothetical protein